MRTNLSLCILMYNIKRIQIQNTNEKKRNKFKIMNYLYANILLITVNFSNHFLFPFAQRNFNMFANTNPFQVLNEIRFIADVFLV